ncbi:helix-turn-helix transcriptional regulator [Solimonas terrae]|uniref:Helix-turn-helix transcriptional regulator n=1 Tax=Solimonas terrae TaxID=1396819 RepID=A0A6M2BRK7_9GAMM|nr:helix-turn-helix transcriptional regulator [Solimonas terrae]NGY04851.1 helix-turn-helix transcriptional regulator [Solimonas terrae]
MPENVHYLREAARSRRTAPTTAALFADDPDGAQLNELLDAIYEGPATRPPWSDALHVLQRRLDAAHVALILRPPMADAFGTMIHIGSEDAAAMESYTKHLFALDPFVHLREGDVVTPEELIGEKWLDGPIYRDYLKPLDVRYLLGADFYTPDGIECRLRITRPHGASPFGEDERALVRFVLPHLKRSLRQQVREELLECERQLLAGTVNRMALGVINLGADGSVLDMNDEAKRILGERDGIILTPAGLSSESLQTRRDLHRLIELAVNKPESRAPGVADAMPIVRPSGRSRLAVLVKPVPPGAWPDHHSRPAAMLFVRDPEANAPSGAQELARRLLGLTRVETRLAMFLTEGHSLDETADLMNIRRNTARTHLRSIFSKTGVTRQTMLVRLMLKSVFTLG